MALNDPLFLLIQIMLFLHFKIFGDSNDGIFNDCKSKMLNILLFEAGFDKSKFSLLAQC